MKLALRVIEPDFGAEHADTFRRDLQPEQHDDISRCTYVPQLRSTG